MSSEHICVCICTYKRPDLLGKLLAELEKQETEDAFSYSVVVVDNDSAGSARGVVDEYARRTKRAVTYDVEPIQNIARARNRAVEKSCGDYVVFFDDDQFPQPDWLLTLFNAQKSYQADGVLGPVRPFFEKVPPKWLIKGRFYERPTYETGSTVQWRMGRTGNVLVKRQLLVTDPNPFDQKFGAGAEDQDFFRRMIEKGHRFIWCNEAVGYEHVPPLRWRRRFLLRRALLRGKVSLKHPGMGMKSVLVSMAAIPLYLLLLPALAVVGQHMFMKYLVKLFDHLGRLLTALGINVVSERYVVD